MVLAGIAMTWHLIHFKYVKFNKASWTEVPARTILLSIPFIIAAMFICNIANEFIELPNLMENTFMGMSRNIFGILAIAFMAPLVEELLFREAIEGHLLQSGKKPKTAIILSALIFGLIHINPAQVLRLLSGPGVRMALLPHRKHHTGHDRTFSEQLSGYHYHGYIN